MISRIGYLLRETGASLQRNITLTVAAIITAAVSLLIFGLTLVIQHGFDNLLAQWEGGVEMIVYVNAGVDDAQRGVIETALTQQEGITINSWRYCDVACSLGDADRLFAGGKLVHPWPHGIAAVPPLLLKPREHADGPCWFAAAARAGPGLAAAGRRRAALGRGGAARWPGGGLGSAAPGTGHDPSHGTGKWDLVGAVALAAVAAGAGLINDVRALQLDGALVAAAGHRELTELHLRHYDSSTRTRVWTWVLSSSAGQ